MKFTIDLPDIDALADVDLSSWVHRHDGKWSDQTKALLRRFQTDLLDLNGWWASTPPGWACPCCGRPKPDLARCGTGGVLLCQLEEHHDHMVDFVEDTFEKVVFKAVGSDPRAPIWGARDAIIALTERFARTVVCTDCNAADGAAKQQLGPSLPKYFSFAPSEIRRFMTADANRPHVIDPATARTIWLGIREDVAARVDFVERMCRRVAAGKHRRERTAPQSTYAMTSPEDILWMAAMRTSPELPAKRMSDAIAVRSMSSDGVGRSARPRKQGGRAPTAEEFAAFDEKSGRDLLWRVADGDWRCEACRRSRFETLRLSNRGEWTARIFKVRVFRSDTSPESLEWRRRLGARSLVFGAHDQALICSDCREVGIKTRRRRPEMHREGLTIETIRGLVGMPVAHADHKIAYEAAELETEGNRAFASAIEDYDRFTEVARSVHEEVGLDLRTRRWSRQHARDWLGANFVSRFPVQPPERNALAGWLLDEADRLRALYLEHRRAYGGAIERPHGLSTDARTAE